MCPIKRKESTSILSRDTVFKNTLINSLGLCLPFLAVLFATPKLIRGLGLERFGVLSLIWAAMGYFSIFEMGIAKALTKFLAESFWENENSQASQIFWTSLTALAVLGVIGVFVALNITHVIVISILKIPLELQKESLDAFYLISYVIPLITISLGLKGALEAYQRFDLSNLVKVPQNVLIFVLPVCVLPVSNNLSVLAGIFLIIWFFTGLCYFLLCVYAIPGIRNASAKINVRTLRKLYKFGIWIAASSIINPLMVYADRFLIGILISITAVSYYVAPYEIVSKLLYIPGALMGVLFPAFAAISAVDRVRMESIFNHSIDYLCIIFIPILLISNTFAHEGLSLWVGAEIAKQSTKIFQLLSIGILFNALAQVPYGLIQSSGRPDLTTKLHFLELPVYLCVLYVLIRNYGVLGAAIAWSVRTMVDMIGLYEIARRLLLTNSIYYRKRNLILLASMVAIIVGSSISNIYLKSIYLAQTILIFCIVAWIFILSSNDKHRIKKLLKIC